MNASTFVDASEEDEHSDDNAFFFPLEFKGAVYNL